MTDSPVVHGELYPTPCWPDVQGVFETIEQYASWTGAEYSWSRDVGKLAKRMRAALELTLLFYHAGQWDLDQNLRWNNLLCEAGIEGERAVTTRALCDTIRQVLGHRKQE